MLTTTSYPRVPPPTSPPESSAPTRLGRRFGLVSVAALIATLRPEQRFGVALFAAVVAACGPTQRPTPRGGPIEPRPAPSASLPPRAADAGSQESDAADAGVSETGDATADDGGRDISEPMPTRDPFAPSTAKGCPQFAPGALFPWRPLPELVGRDKTAIIACYGPPPDASASVWSYRTPRGCAYEKLEIEITFQGGAVVRARMRGFVTGQHCQLDY